MQQSLEECDLLVLFFRLIISFTSQIKLSLRRIKLLSVNKFTSERVCPN
jgi:hypothetical protein